MVTGITTVLFSEKRGLPIFEVAMGKHLFLFITRHLCFDNFETREERWRVDPFAAMLDFLEQCNERFEDAIVSEDYIWTDETYYPTCNHVSFKQYNPDQLAKYEMLFKLLNSAQFPFTYQTHTYGGKSLDTPNEYYFQSTYSYIKYFVERLSWHDNIHGRNTTMDRSCSLNGCLIKTSPCLVLCKEIISEYLMKIKLLKTENCWTVKFIMKKMGQPTFQVMW